MSDAVTLPSCICNLCNVCISTMQLQWDLLLIVCLFAFLWCYRRRWRTQRYKGALAHSAASVILDAKHSTGCAINICWHASVLQYRRGQTADVSIRCAAISLTVPRICICIRPSVCCSFHASNSRPVLLSLHICVCVRFPLEKHSHENHHLAVIHKKNCTSFPLPLPHQKLLRPGNPVVLNRVLLVWLPV